ncbi:MAG: TfoX/Sxy family protein [Bacteroidia bacterium]|jgi:TfoX/Sxy family transcriptional regulator of competence genes
MAYSEKLASRIRAYLSATPDVEEKAMMGGLTFMVNDKMCVGILKDELMCRVQPDLHDTLVEKTGCRTMDFTKRPMKGYVMIDETGMRSDKDFSYWINLSLKYNKEAKSSKKKKSK